MNVYTHETISTSSVQMTDPEKGVTTQRYSTRHVYRLFGFTILTWTNTHTVIR